MRAGYSEALAMLGYVLGMVVTPVVGSWANRWDVAVGDTLLMCSLLFELAFFFGLVRLLFRGARWLVHAPERRRRRTVSRPAP
ncbi:hypothetical protein [Nonomuraea sp. NPDC048916]|uniref:hypothetical protein n=1 Tax=Nonomuraea sp. NPDC048916 TaxID=3154232 RepID=UPI003409FA86